MNDYELCNKALENKSQEEIARDLNISTRSVARYYQRIEKRYGEIQRLKTDNTIFLEAQMFKNRMINLYNILEKKAEAIVEAAEQNPELYLYAPLAAHDISITVVFYNIIEYKMV